LALSWSNHVHCGAAWAWFAGQPQNQFYFCRLFRESTRAASNLSSPKALGDFYLLALGRVSGSTLVTFDAALASACRKARQPVALLG
jgi:hypothetical protein